MSDKKIAFNLAKVEETAKRAMVPIAFVKIAIDHVKEITSEEAKEAYNNKNKIFFNEEKIDGLRQLYESILQE